jgi:hypothetical protein
MLVKVNDNGISVFGFALPYFHILFIDAEDIIKYLVPCIVLHYDISNFPSQDS